MIDFTTITDLTSALSVLKAEAAAAGMPLVVENPGFRQWPFLGADKARDLLRAEPRVALAAFAVEYYLLEEFERTQRETIAKDRQGFMGSHATNSCYVFEAFRAGNMEPPTPRKGWRADGHVFDTGLAYATHIGTRYASGVMKAIVAHERRANEAVDQACRVISP